MKNLIFLKNMLFFLAFAFFSSSNIGAATFNHQIVEKGHAVIPLGVFENANPSLSIGAIVTLDDNVSPVLDKLSFDAVEKTFNLPFSDAQVSIQGQALHDGIDNFINYNYFLKKQNEGVIPLFLKKYYNKSQTQKQTHIPLIFTNYGIIKYESNIRISCIKLFSNSQKHTRYTAKNKNRGKS